MIKVALSGTGSENEKKQVRGQKGEQTLHFLQHVNFVNEFADIFLLYCKVTFPKIVIQIMAKFNVTHWFFSPQYQ